MLDALKKAGLGDSKKIQCEEEKKTAALCAEEKRNYPLGIRLLFDEKKVREQEKYYADAAKEGRRAASKVGSKQYFDRFKR